MFKNNEFQGLYNGLIGAATGDSEMCVWDEKYIIHFDGEEYGAYAGDITGDDKKYDAYKEEYKKLERFEYAYAITCHLSQGSEFNNVVLINEPFGKGDEPKRWLYTAITRAKEKCIMVDSAR
jgi:ATP-dependent exoDNAse (exonuclease V) alpha subunit